MPEYPDITVYLEALDQRIRGRQLRDVTINSPFLLRTVTPGIDAFAGQKVTGFKRIGKRIALGFEGELWMVLHLMIAGRLHWKETGARAPGKSALLCLCFDNGILYLTEAGKKKRASLHLLRGADQLAAMDPGGINVLTADLKTFTESLVASNHTLKRSLTDPRIFSGIGNAYSDEILHQAGLSPIAMTQKLGEDEIKRLYDAVRDSLEVWTERLRQSYGDNFPEKVTAFREDMAAHGRYGLPCPVCQTPIQRIRYATNETNYCPRCQTGGKVLADRALSRLLKKDWPRSIEELDKLKGSE